MTWSQCIAYLAASLGLGWLWGYCWKYVERFWHNFTSF